MCALEHRGLLTRARDPRDARAWHITATQRGVRLAEQAIDVVEAQDRAFFARADPAELLRTL